MNTLNKFFVPSKNHPEITPLVKQRSEALMFNLQNAIDNKRPIDIHVVREELVDLITTQAGGLVPHPDCKNTMEFSPKEMQNTLKHAPYLALTDVLVYIPRGMKGTYMQTAIGLNKIAGLMKDIESSVVDPLVKYTAGLVEKPQDLNRPFPIKESVSVKEVKALLDDLYKTPSETVQAKYGDVIRRNADWVDTGVLNAEIQETLNPERLESLIKKHNRVRELSKLLDSVLDRGASDLSGSGKTIQDFVNYTYYAATLLTLYGLVNSHAIAFNVSLNDNLERLKSITR